MARRCSSGKKHFKNRGDALNYMRTANAKSPGTLKLRSVYSCPGCQGWHMTSLPRHGRKASAATQHVSMDQLRSYALEVRRNQIPDPEQLTSEVSSFQRRFSGIIAAAAQNAQGAADKASDGQTVR